MKNCFRRYPHLMLGLIAVALSAPLPSYLFLIRPPANTSLAGFDLTISGELTAAGIIVGLIFAGGNTVMGAAMIVGFWRLATWATRDN